MSFKPLFLKKAIGDNIVQVDAGSYPAANQIREIRFNSCLVVPH